MAEPWRGVLTSGVHQSLDEEGLKADAPSLVWREVCVQEEVLALKNVLGYWLMRRDGGGIRVGRTTRTEAPGECGLGQHLGNVCRVETNVRVV